MCDGVVCEAVDKAKQAGYIAWGLATVFDLMGAGEWEQAEALTGYLLAAVDQSTLDGGRWQTAWMLTHLPEPPWRNIQRPPASSSSRPRSREGAMARQES